MRSFSTRDGEAADGYLLVTNRQYQVNGLSGQAVRSGKAEIVRQACEHEPSRCREPTLAPKTHLGEHDETLDSVLPRQFLSFGMGASTVADGYFERTLTATK